MRKNLLFLGLLFCGACALWGCFSDQLSHTVAVDDELQKMLLFKACDSNNEALLARILKQNPSHDVLFAVNADSQTLLHRAVRSSGAPLVKRLLAAGFSPDQSDAFGKTPHDYALLLPESDTAAAIRDSLAQPFKCSVSEGDTRP